ncbi:MAG: cell wall hydrolase [Pseudolabrys sp.]|nr:cell wall hydrolase [Pseudolabrys sp.]
MSVLHRRRKRFAFFCIGLVVFGTMPHQIGFQDLGALLAQQPAVKARWHRHLATSPFGTVHASIFRLPNPLGTAIPAPPLYALASVDPNDITGSIAREALGDQHGPLQFPTINRKNKGDSLVLRPRQPLPPLAPRPVPEVAPQADEPSSMPSEATKQDQAALPDDTEKFEPYREYETPPAPEALAKLAPDVELPYVDLPPVDLGKPGRGNPTTADLYFGVDPVPGGAGVTAKIEPWKSGEAPVVVAPQRPAETTTALAPAIAIPEKPIAAPQPSGDRDIKLSALTPQAKHDPSTKPGESIAPKGQVTGEGKRPMSPAERLKLTGVGRAKAEKCLANAVYFESRGEPVRGQIAVAQVVMNRVFSGYYPNDVCGVVYQNAHRHLSCQFTFACDGIPDVVTEQDAWIRAKRIAADTLDGKLWMPEVAKSTHYHAYWVRPSWVNEMKKLLKLGVHTFYRPRAWGEGEDAPSWGDAKYTAEAAAKL